MGKKLESACETPLLDEDVGEISLLMPGWQLLALADAAEADGITVGQYIRRLVTHALASGARRSYHSA